MYASIELTLTEAIKNTLLEDVALDASQNMFLKTLIN